MAKANDANEDEVDCDDTESPTPKEQPAPERTSTVEDLRTVVSTRDTNETNR